MRDCYNNEHDDMVGGTELPGAAVEKLESRTF